MKSLLSFFLLFLSVSLIAQDQNEALFGEARSLLASRQMEAAIIPLKKLYLQDEENGNINFLLGAAYTEMLGAHPQAVYHLKKAFSKVTTDYDASSVKESNAPLHTYYYLTIAFVEENRCLEAREVWELLDASSDHIDGFYVREANRHLQKCDFSVYTVDDPEAVLTAEEEVPEGYDPKAIPTVKPIEAESIDESTSTENLESVEKKDPYEGLITEKIEYTTDVPLYGVQIGAFNEVIPVNRFTNIKNVDAFVDNKGLIRYVVGHFSIRSQAESLKEVIFKNGYTDAFIVNVNDERKYKQSVVSFNNVNIRSGIKGKVDFKVQIGAFEQSVPKDLAEMYLKIDDIDEIKYEKLTLLTVGSFRQFDEAESKKEELRALGLPDAFVVAFNRGKKVPLDEVKHIRKR